jgi:hypothetical protein
VLEIFQCGRVSADESCVKLPLRGVCGTLRLPGGGEAAADSPAGRIQTPRSGSFHLVMSADATGTRNSLRFNASCAILKMYTIHGVADTINKDNIHFIPNFCEDFYGKGH